MATTADPQSGHPGHLTPDQQATLTSFRTLLSSTTPPLIPASPTREEHTAKLGYDRYSDAALLPYDSCHDYIPPDFVLTR